MEISNVAVGSLVRANRAGFGFESSRGEGRATDVRAGEVGEVIEVIRDAKGLDLRVKLGTRPLWFISNVAGSLDALEVAE